MSESSPRAPVRGETCVVIAVALEEQMLRCERSVRDHTDASVRILRAAATPADINDLLVQLAPADVLLLSEPCVVGAAWLERMRAAAHASTNTATASAFVDVGGPLALSRDGRPHDHIDRLIESVAQRSASLRPRLNGAVGPCVYVTREAIELVGTLDEQLDLRAALEVDFAQRCVLWGLAHVAADDVVVRRIAAPQPAPTELPERLRERYPYLRPGAAAASSAVLGQALDAVRAPPPRLSVTVDVRALGGTTTGTQVHILELVRALSRTGDLRLRLLVSARRLDSETRAELQALDETELLAEEGISAATPPSTVFHRPQQTFSTGDVSLAVQLGQHVVISQLDMIAYRNPGYFEGLPAWEDFQRSSRQGLAASERVVVFSEHTRGELLSDALVEPSRIRVVPPGLDHVLDAKQRRPASLARDGGNFLLCLGTDFRHKNRVFALGLFRSLRERHTWDGRLVLAGTHVEHGSSRELERAILGEVPELRQSVVDLGPVEEPEKAWLIANADAVLYPSVYEGFGLIPFECALGGTLCLFAPQSSLAELAPAQTATIVPWDLEQSADVAHALLSDTDQRARLVDTLASVARKLTWAATAASLVDVYREAARAPLRDAATVAHELLADRQALIHDHDALVARLVQEREHARTMYDRLNTEVGDGLGLIGPHGSLPDDLQRALLALSARPALSRPSYSLAARVFAAARSVARLIARARRGRS
jgi:glycosyltransferase involved in cell wall biosynthesis